MNARVVIVDDHKLFHIGFRELLAGSSIEVVGGFESGQAADQWLTRHSADLLMMDVRLQAPDGLDWIEIFQKRYNLPTVVMSGFDNPVYMARAYALGARDYLIKNGEVDRIVDVIERAIDGRPPRDDSPMGRVAAVLNRELQSQDMPAGFPLTGREAQVLRHLAYGLSNREIAKSLSLSIETIKEHVQNVIRKIEAADRTDAAVRAIKAGLVE